jgi:protocatechuate 3,4-dioxygenase beta subunit
MIDRHNRDRQIDLNQQRVNSPMNSSSRHSSRSRRQFLHGLGLTTALFTVPGAFAEELIRTPKQTKGPFYPDHLPLDTDNDLLVLDDSATPALGEVTWLSGRVLDTRGKPMRNVGVEIWQCDNNDAYLHSKTGSKEKQDMNFQGFGRFVTGTTGEYLFRTIKPVPYPGRAPHVHFKIKQSNKDLLVTQCYILGHPGNEKGGSWSGIKDEKQRESVTIDFKPLPSSRIGELTAKFDIALWFMPTE